MRLGDVATYVNGYAFKPTDYCADGLPIIRIQNLTGNAYETNRFDGALSDKYRVENGDILISWSASLGVYRWNRGEAWLNQHIFKVVFDKLPVNLDFFVYQAGYLIENSTSLAHGATMRHLTKKVFDSRPFFYPPIDVQAKIARTLMSVDAILAYLHLQVSKLDDLVKSRFVEMFGDKERWASEGWPIAAVSDLICKPKSGEWGEEDLCGKGIKVLRTANFTDAGVINYTNVVTRDIDCSKLKSKGLCTGDILIEKSGGSDKKPVGRVVLFLNQNDTYLNNNFTAALRVKDPSKISYRYLFQSLYMNYWRGGTRPFESKTTGLHNLKLDGYLSKTRIPIPSIEIQQQFADFVARVDKLGFDKACREP
ncbi:restriction endonuclease subunit S [Olsenella uli]|uniref:restriction endonuclease subunit S n=1 Tax=Olsenella uli TaxID=133926 RepID=UPI003D7B4845